VQNTSQMTTEEIAKAAHEVMHVYCAAIGEPILAWDEMTELFRNHAIDSATFRLENPDVPFLEFNHSTGEPLTNTQRTMWLIHTTVINALSHRWA